MKITKRYLKKVIREMIGEDDDLMADPIGGAAVLPGRGRAVQQALDALRRALGPEDEAVRQAMEAFTAALQTAGYDVQHPSRTQSF
jgi:hypothetical protein